MHARVFERGLDMFEEMLGLEHLRMTPVEPSEEVLPGPTRSNADLPQRRLECRVVAETASSKRLLNGVVNVMALELRDPPGAVAPHTRQPQDVPFAQSGADEHRDELDKGQVLFSHVLLGHRARQSER